MELLITEIKIRNRLREDLGDIKALATSIQNHGLLHPVVVNQHMELIAGHRRIEAAKSLGWSSIEARILTDADKISHLEIELEENLARKQLNADEMAEGYKRLEKLRRPSWWKRFFIWLKSIWNRLFGT